MSVLLIDAGNTRLKWQWRQDSVIVASGMCAYVDFPVDVLPNELSVEFVLVASVQGESPLRAALAQKYGAKLQWLNSPQLDHPAFIHCYKQPERFGVDRWLALLGARSHYLGDILVADLGTAFTIDVMSQHNQHLGGFIVPGLQMAQDALFANTQRVRAFSNEEKNTTGVLGRDTVGCVSGGAHRQIKALLQSVMHEYCGHKVFVCGGDGAWLAQMTGTEFYPDLVFDGMESLCAGSF